jgi:hypothetical protein
MGSVVASWALHCRYGEGEPREPGLGGQYVRNAHIRQPSLYPKSSPATPSTKDDEVQGTMKTAEEGHQGRKTAAQPTQGGLPRPIAGQQVKSTLSTEQPNGSPDFRERNVGRRSNRYAEIRKTVDFTTTPRIVKDLCRGNFRNFFAILSAEPPNLWKPAIWRRTCRRWSSSTPHPA